MSGYIELNRTGFAPFDDALSLFEEAGTSYYHTSQWIDDGWNGEKPYLTQINESIAFAAKSYLNLQEQIIELTQQRDLAVEALEKALRALIHASAHVDNEDFVKVMMARDTINETLSTIKESEAK